jgi:hypothetical protein
MAEVIFEDFPLSKKQIADITAILKLVFQKGEKWIDNYCGIVIAGFGEREIFPVVYDFKVSGKLGNSLLYFGTDIDQIGNDHTASIIPFAQSEMVHQFARGMDRDLRDKIIERVDTILSQLAPLINDPDKEKVAAISNLLEEYLDDHSRKVFIDPIIDIVACMQTSELVSMADAMVNLTALKRHVSTDDETVGGPVDVAMITRGEGFIWIKRKTNYDPNLNRHLNQKYFRGGEK